jgi:DNA topoisomerase VI subunit A
MFKSDGSKVSSIPTSQSVGPVLSGARRLVIVEKESAICQLQQEGNGKEGFHWSNTVFLSAKGYPDRTSRRVVEALLG